MVKKYICRNCGCKFEEDVISREEAKERRVSLHPVKCPKCGSIDVERR